MNHNDEFRSETANLDDELAIYNDAVEFAELLEASSFGTPTAAAARRTGGGVLVRYRFSPPNLTAAEPQASDLAEFVGEHFKAAGRSDVAELWFQAAIVEDGALPSASPTSAPRNSESQSCEPLSKDCGQMVSRLTEPRFTYTPTARSSPEPFAISSTRSHYNDVASAEYWRSAGPPLFPSAPPPRRKWRSSRFLTVAAVTLNESRQLVASFVGLALAVLAVSGILAVVQHPEPSIPGPAALAHPMPAPADVPVLAPRSTGGDVSLASSSSSPDQQHWTLTEHSFYEGSSTLSPAGKEALDGVIQRLISDQEIRVEVAVWTVAGGDDAARLLEERERAVTSVFDASNIPADRFTITGHLKAPGGEVSSSDSTADDTSDPPSDNESSPGGDLQFLKDRLKSGLYKGP